MPVPFEIRLNSGRSIELRKLDQILTYEGLIEGLPTTRMNQRLIASTLENVLLPYRKANREANVYLVPPTEREIKYEREKPYPFGDPSELPAVKCIATFLSDTPARDESQWISWLVIVWFQEQFALPLDEDIEAHIKSMDWDAVAVDDEI